MITRIDPRDEGRLLWFFNDAYSEIDKRPSIHESVVRRGQFVKIVRPNHLNGGRESDIPYVGSIKPPYREPEHPDDDHPGMKAAAAERHMRRQLEAAGPEAHEVLRRRFSEGAMRECRVPFGFDGKATVMSRGTKLTLTAVRKPRECGAGAIAHLTDAARAAYAWAMMSGTRLDVETWVDRLGMRLAKGTATASERTLGREIERQANKLALWAWGRFRGSREARPIFSVAQRPALAA